jgi:hypothetical protein
LAVNRSAADTDVIGLVSCGASKLPHAAPARDLYTSPLFRKSLAYAERTCARVYILSAKHGLVELDQVLAPYDVKLVGGWRVINPWAERVTEQLVARHRTESVDVMILAGRAYADRLAECIHFARITANADWRTFEPMQHMQVGERLQWLNRQLSRALRAKEAGPAPRADRDAPPAAASEPALFLGGDA